MGDTETELVRFDEALVHIREALGPPEPDTPQVPFELFIQRISLPLIIAERVSDQAKASVGSWLVWGYENYAKPQGKNISEFCRAVNESLKELGRTDLVIPAVETLRGWYYQASKPSTMVITDEDGFGLGAACNLSNDPTGERAFKLRSAAQLVHMMTNMGQVTAARYLKQAYGGHNEQEWADGLPTFTTKPTRLVSTLTGEEHNCVSIMANWYDGTQTEIGIFMDPKSHEGRTQIASRYALSLLRVHLEKEEENAEGSA